MYPDRLVFSWLFYFQRKNGPWAGPRKFGRYEEEKCRWCEGVFQHGYSGIGYFEGSSKIFYVWRFLFPNKVLDMGEEHRLILDFIKKHL